MIPRRPHLTTLGLAFAAGLLAFLPALRNGFVDWDDTFVLVRNDRFRGFDADRLAWMFTTTHKGPYQPLSWLSYAVDHAVWGMDPFGYHLTNLLLHALATALVAAVALRLLPRLVGSLAGQPGTTCATALLAAVVWGCHPLRVESVAWATERRDVLSGALFLASLLAWLRFTDPEQSDPSRRTARRLSIVWFTLSLLAKGTAMGTALLLLCADPLLRPDVPWRRRLADVAPFAVLALPIAAIALWGQSDVGAAAGLTEYGPLDRLALAAYSVAFYAFRTLVPLDLRAHYERPWPLPYDDAAFTGGVVAGAVLAGLALWGAARRSPFGVAGVAYLTLLAPVSGVVVVGTHLVAERYAYLATIPLALTLSGCAAAVVSRLSSTPRRATVATASAATALAVALGSSSWPLVRTWGSTETLFARVLAFEETNWLAHFKVGMELSERGQVRAARDHLQRSVELYPAQPAEVWARLAHLEFDLGRADVAERLGRKALQLDETTSAAWALMARVREGQGDLESAAACLRKALVGAEREPEVVAHLAFVLVRLHRVDEAAALVDEVLAARPRHAGAWRIRGLVLDARGDGDGAVAALRTSLELAPGTAPTLAALASALERQRRLPEAEAVLREALAADPRDDVVRVQLGALRERAGDLDGAAALYREALALRSSSPVAHFRLGLVMARTGDLDRAEGHLRRCVELDGGTSATSLGALCDVLTRRGRLDDALRVCDAVAERHPARPEAHLERGRLLDRAGRRTEAVTAYRAAVATSPDDPAALTQLARAVAADPAHRAEAAALLERALALRDEPRIRLGLAELYAHEGQVDEARAHAERALGSAEARGDAALAARARSLLASL